MAARTYSLRELQDLSGIQARTLRSWIKMKLISRPTGKGRGARYTEGQLLRARVIAQLRSKGTALRDIRAQLARLGDEQMSAMLRGARQVSEAQGPAPEAPPAPTYPSVTWEVIELMAGLVLLVNPAKGPVMRRIAEEIHRHYAGPGQG